MENTPRYDHFPVWAFLEVIPFREFIYFYQFCITEIRSKHYQQYRALTFLLKTVNRARNAAAHNSCFINDLKLITEHPSKDRYISANKLLDIQNGDFVFAFICLGYPIDKDSFYDSNKFDISLVTHIKE